MKNIIFLINIIICLSSTISINGQHRDFYSRPAIDSIDGWEKRIFKNDRLSLVEFYSSLEKNVVPRHIDSIYMGILERDFIVFVINKWLYVVSYNHINNSHIDNDYDPDNKILKDLYKQGYALQRNLNLYCKYVGDTKQNNWKLANNNAILSHANAYPLSSNTCSFYPHYDRISIPIKYNERVLKSKNNEIFLLCGINEIDYNGGSDMDKNVYYQKLLTLSPEETYSDGSIYFNIEKFFHDDLYIKKLNKINYITEKIIVNAVDNNGNPCSIESKSGKIRINMKDIIKY
jgi:hypothetical protein